MEYEDQEEQKQQKVKARLIIEMIGKPKEHVEEQIRKRFQLLKDKGLNITKEEFFEAEEKEQGAFSTFVEFTAEFENSKKVFDFCFDEMPSTIEIIEPKNLDLDAKYYTNILNDMLAKLHQVDLMVKTIKAHNIFLDKNTVAVLRNFIYHLSGTEGMTTEDMSKIVGIKTKELQPFIDRMLELKSVKEKDGKYYQIPKKEENKKKDGESRTQEKS